MATFFFETMDAADGLRFAQGDTLVFSATGQTAQNTTVRRDPSTGQVTLTSVAGKSVTFFTDAFALRSPLFSDGSNLIVGDFRVQMATGLIMPDFLLGGDGADALNGGAGNDMLRGEQGDDIIEPGSGNDVVFGDAGVDVAVMSGTSKDFVLSYQPNSSGPTQYFTIGTSGALVLDTTAKPTVIPPGPQDARFDTEAATAPAADAQWKIIDIRAGSPDGTDRLIGVETLRFTDRDATIGVNLPDATNTTFLRVLRASPSSPNALATGITEAAKLAGGAGAATIIQDVVRAAAATTSVATLSYQFFTNKAPSAGGIDYLVAPTGANPNNLNSTYYQSFNLENRYINFAVNLGRDGEGKAAFAAAYGSKTLFDSTKAAYTTIFGGTPSDAKVHALIDSRVDYFAFYGQDGANGIGTKAAMVGWLLAEASKANVGMFVLSNNAFLTAVATNNAPFAVDIVGTYGQGNFNFDPN